MKYINDIGTIARNRLLAAKRDFIFKYLCSEYFKI